MKETIIFMHGGIGTKEVFETEKQALQHLYQCYSYNYYDGNMEAEAYTVDFFIAQLLDQFEKNKIKSAHLCALSFGSLIARVFAERYPERVKSLVFVGGYICNDVLLKRITNLLTIEPHENYQSWVRKCAASLNPNSPLLRENSEWIFKRGALALSPSLFKRTLHIHFDLKDASMRKIACPVLWMMGEHDQLYKSTLPPLNKLGPHIEYKEIKQAGHAAHIHQQKHFLAELQLFLTKQQVNKITKQV